MSHPIQMTTTPRHAPRPCFRADIQQIEQYFAALPITDGAINELAIGKVRPDNPAKIDAYPPKPAWGEGQRFRWYSTETRGQLIQDIAQLIQKYGNVYISRAQYRSPKRDAAVALSSRVLFFDDVDPNDDFSMLVQTSAQSYQGYVFLNEDADAATIRELGERGAKALSGAKDGHADTCYDVTRLVRIPGSYNTKNGVNFPVRPVSITDKTYSIAELRDCWPPVERTAPTAADLNWKEAEHCYGMVDGIEKRISQHTKTYQQLHSDGGTDRSKTRYALACELRRRFAYPNEEIAALLYHYHFEHLGQKGSTWLINDIKRCIAAANRRYPDVKTNPSYCRLSWQSKPVQPLPQVERPKTGRRRCLTDEQYLAWLKKQAVGASGAIMMTQAETAQANGVSIPTIRRLEKRLQHAGLIKRRTVRKKGGSYSYLVFYSAITTPEKVDIKNSQAASLVRSTNNDQAQHHAENIETASVVGVTHPPDRGSPEPQPAPRPSLGQAVNAVRSAGARTRQQVYRMLGEYFAGHDWTPAAIDRAYDGQRLAEQERRKRERLMERVSSMTRPELRKAIRSAERHIARSHEKQNNVWKFWTVYRNHCERQLQRMIANDNRERRKAQELVPMPAMVFEPEPALADLPAGLSGGCVPPLPDVGEIQPPGRQAAATQPPAPPCPLVPSYVAGVRVMSKHGGYDSRAVQDYLKAKQVPDTQHYAYIEAAQRRGRHARSIG